MQQIGIYLAGRITNLPDKGEGWRREYFEQLNNGIKNIKYIGPKIERYNQKFSEDTIRQDINLIQESDIMIINATMPFFIGAPMELILAKYFNKLVITVTEDKSPYYENNISNPWISYFSDYNFNSISKVVELLKIYQINSKNVFIKTKEQLFG